MRDSPNVLEALKGKSAILFFIAGGLLVVFAANTGARVFTNMSYSAVHSTFGPAGFFFGIVGLFGVYPTLAGQTPWGARVAAVVAAIPAIGWLVITVFGIGSTAGFLPGLSVVFSPVFPILVFLTTILAYISFGIGSLRGGVHSRAVGIALLVPAVPFVTLIVGVAILGPVEWTEFAIDGGHALAHLAVGVTLRTRGLSANRAEPAVEATP